MRRVVRVSQAHITMPACLHSPLNNTHGAALQTQRAIAQTKVLNHGSSLIQVLGPDPHPEVSLQLVKPLTSKGHWCCMKAVFPKHAKRPKTYFHCPAAVFVHQLGNRM